MTYADVVVASVVIPATILGLSYGEWLALVSLLIVGVTWLVFKPARVVFETRRDIETIKGSLVLTDGTSLAEQVERLVQISEDSAHVTVKLQDWVEHELQKTNGDVSEMNRRVDAAFGELLKYLIEKEEGNVQGR